MKLRLLVLSAVIVLGACNSNSKETATTEKDSTLTDSTVVSEVKPAATATPVVVKNAAPAQSTAVSSTRMTSESENEAKKKEGWSKTAKGAVIGGVVGAGTGAVINKKNRVAGAVIGGVVGAGTGAVIGNELDKKDGRH